MLRYFLLLAGSRFKQGTVLYSLDLRSVGRYSNHRKTSHFSKVYRKDRPRHAQAGAALCFLCEAPWLVAHCGSMGCAPL